jgi:DUF1680 family protein
MKNRLIFFLTCICLFSAVLVAAQDYPIQPVPFTAVKLSDDFWAPRIERNYKVTIPIALKQCYTTGRVDNFLIAGKLKTGTFCTEYPFDDTDIYKIIEGASYSLQTFPDKQLEARIDTLIGYIGKAQEPDGYLYTARTIDPEHPHSWAGSKRWEKVTEGSHELYNSGHLFEAAVAHYQATGKRSLLDIAIKNADMLCRTFGPDKLDRYPGHQIVEMGLVKMYRVTGKKEYLHLAKFFLDARHDGSTYNQSHKKVVDQTEAVGHAVRATYMYSGMADVAALTGDQAYIKAIDAIWEDVVRHKIYITGGIGSVGGHEGFGPAYDLPNMVAYNETCAAIGNVFWNHRLFLLHGDAKYIDVLERTLYNGMISGVSLSGDHFFYPNPLASLGQHERSEWFGCACCPSNVCRFLPSVPGYMYGVDKNRLYVNLFIQSTATIELVGKKLEFAQESDYPWSGEVVFHVRPQKPAVFEIAVRIPGWARNQPIPGDLYSFADADTNRFYPTVNGDAVPYVMENGYAVLKRKWQKGDRVRLELPMPVRLVRANEKVAADRDKLALQRGPIVYCAEWPDYKDGKVLDLLLPADASLSSTFRPDMLSGVQVISGEAEKIALTDDDRMIESKTHFTAIPYFAWANRGPGQMSVWIADKPGSAHAVKPTIASSSTIEASHKTATLVALNDQFEPTSSNDPNVLHYHWWPLKDTVQWVQYVFAKPARVSSVKVYWFDDGPSGGCRVPESWKLYYRTESGGWQEVKSKSEYGIEKDRYNIAYFEPVETGAMKMEVKLSKDYSAGILEWAVE